MNKKWLSFICWIISTLYALVILLIPILFITYVNSIVEINIFLREYINTPFKIAGLIAFGFWIYNIVIWNKRRDGAISLLLLLFLNVLYAPIYYFNKIIRPHIKKVQMENLSFGKDDHQKDS